MSKIDISAVFEMFEAINSKLDKRTDVQSEQRIAIPTETASIDKEAVNSVLERLEGVVEEVKKPAKVEHQHRHTIDIGANWVLISLAVMVLVILGLSFVVGQQRQSISQYHENDLKYRYIKMQGQTNEENIYRLERQFRHGDSVKIVRKQVEKYEELVREQAERLERARRNDEEAKKLMEEMERIR